jgi:hypothetical protein
MRFIILLLTLAHIVACQQSGSGGNQTSSVFLFTTSIPASGASNIPISQTFQVSFSDPVDASTIISNTCTAVDYIQIFKSNSTSYNSSSCVPISFSVSKNQLNIILSTNLDPNTKYTLKILSTLENTQGQRLEQDVQINFTTNQNLANQLFSANFESTTVRRTSSPQTDVVGVFDSNGDLNDAPIYYEKGTSNDRGAIVQNDPAVVSNQVLGFWLKNAAISTTGGGKGRVQLAFANVNHPVAYQKGRMYLPADLNLYRQYPDENGWFTINEFWAGADWDNMPYPFRITLNIVKPAGINQPLYFSLAGANMNNGSGVWETVWGEVNAGFEIPTGEWLDFELGFQQGDANTGRVYFAVKRASDLVLVKLFDINNWTYHPSSPQPVPMTHWHPFKLYTSHKIIDYIRNNGGMTSIYFDNLSILDAWPQ